MIGCTARDGAERRAGFPPLLRPAHGIIRRGRVRITISKENYLKAIAEAESEGETVKAVTLTRWLHVSAPAVTMAIKRLKRDALIRVAGEGQITLTAAGREIANRLLNRHHLIERMLTEIFGLEWYKVHDEAEQLEHAVSADFERKLVERLGRGGTCPHGNIVGMDSPARAGGAASSRSKKPRPGSGWWWSACSSATAAAGVSGGPGIRPGAEIEVDGLEAGIRLRAAGRPVNIERAAAARIWVKPQTP